MVALIHRTIVFTTPTSLFALNCKFKHFQLIRWEQRLKFRNERMREWEEARKVGLGIVITA